MLITNSFHFPIKKNKSFYSFHYSIVPFLEFLCLLYGKAVNLVFKDGRIKEIHQTATLSLNGTYVELAILASAESPVNSTPLNLTRNNETLAHSVSENY